MDEWKRGSANISNWWLFLDYEKVGFGGRLGY
jgi:hypothetical protein